MNITFSLCHYVKTFAFIKSIIYAILNEYVFSLKYKQALLDELRSRVENKIIEENNYILLKKLIEKAETLEEAIAIQQL